MVSSTNAAYNLTVNNSASGHYGLIVMTITAALFFPIVLLYQGWSFHVFRRRVECAPDLVGLGAERVRALDPRLLARTKSVRPLLVVDCALGIGTALAVLLGATMLARIAARAFHGAPLRDLWADSPCWYSHSRCAGACAWAMEVAGRRAAWSVLSELRLALVERRLRANPTSVDGAGGAEITAVSVQGVEALEGYFARYLPQVVLASIVPLLVIAWVAFWTSRRR